MAGMLSPAVDPRGSLWLALSPTSSRNAAPVCTADVNSSPGPKPARNTADRIHLPEKSHVLAALLVATPPRRPARLKSLP
jgi:hypothetical protein